MSYELAPARLRNLRDSLIQLSGTGVQMNLRRYLEEDEGRPYGPTKQIGEDESGVLVFLIAVWWRGGIFFVSN